MTDESRGFGGLAMRGDIVSDGPYSDTPSCDLAAGGLGALVTLAKRGKGIVRIRVEKHPNGDVWALLGEDAQGRVFYFSATDDEWIAAHARSSLMLRHRQRQRGLRQ